MRSRRRGVSVVFFPARSTTPRHPPSSSADGVVHEGDAVPARRENRGLPIQPRRLVEQLADGVLEAPTSRDPTRTTARSRPSGEKSANSTFSRISRGAPPPVAAVRASVPVRVNAPDLARRARRRCRPTAVTARTSAPFSPKRARLRALGAREEDLDRVAFPRGGVDDGLAVGPEARGPDGAAAERELLEGGRPGRARPAECNERETAPPASAAMTTAPARTAAVSAARACRGRSPPQPRSLPERPESASRSNARSRAEWKRSSGFFSRQCRTIALEPGVDVPVRRREVRRVLPEDRRDRLGRRVAAGRRGCPSASRRGPPRRRRCRSARRSGGPSPARATCSRASP